MKYQKFEQNIKPSVTPKLQSIIYSNFAVNKLRVHLENSIDR